MILLGQIYHQIKYEKRIGGHNEPYLKKRLKIEVKTRKKI